MRTVVIDCETDGLAATKVHVICCEDINTGELFDFVGLECYTKFPKFCEEVNYFICHNIVSFDCPIFNRLLGTTITLNQAIDTLIMSKLFDPDRGTRKGDKYKGNKPHSLEAWGVRLGYLKPEHEDWSVYSKEMHQRCRADVTINKRTYYRLLQEQKSYGFAEQSVRSEHLIRHYVNQQQINGFHIDMDKLEALHSETSKIALALEIEILTEFPPIALAIREITPRFKKDGGLSKVGLDDYEWDMQPHYPFTRIEWQPFILTSPKQVVHRLNKLGWKPYEKTKGHIKALKSRKTSQEDLDYYAEYGWKVCEENLETLPEDAPAVAHKIVDYVMVKSRQRYIETQMMPHLKEC